MPLTMAWREQLSPWSEVLAFSRKTTAEVDSFYKNIFNAFVFKVWAYLKVGKLLQQQEWKNNSVILY